MFDLLAGCRIIDVTSIVLGPYATQILGDMGADVIKVEPPGGDLMRASSPSRSAGMSPAFMNLNRNKRSLAIDLKTGEGRAIMRDLAGRADVFVHNMRPQAAARLDLSYDDLSAINPRLVYCIGPGFGQDGRYADYPAYDDIIQAMTGISRLNAGSDGEPRFFPSIACDKITGLHLALAVLGGLMRRERSGEGCYIEAPMFESILSFLYTEHLDERTFRPANGKTGYHRILNPYRKPYKTKNGHIAVLPYSAAQWSRFFTLAGRDELASADWLQDSAARSRRVVELYAIVEEIMPLRTSEDWLADLRRLEIPCAPVNDLDGLLGDPHLAETDFFRDIEHPSEGALVSVRSPFLTQGVETSPDRFVPRTGQHTREILEELGMDESRIETLLEEGVVSAG